MKDILSRIVAYLIITLVIFVSFWYLSAAPKVNTAAKSIVSSSKTYVSSLGNFLARYFYYVSTNVPAANNVPEAIIFDAGNDVQLGHLYNQLAWDPHELKFDFISDPNFTWTQVDGDGNLKPNYLRYWQTMRPIMQQTYLQTLQPVVVTNPVVHFRCSDVPFNKHAVHHLTTTESVNWMAQQIKDQGYDKLTFLTCNSHLSAGKNSCDKYVQFYTKIFNAAGLKVETHCGTILDDFAMMYYSPLLVSLNASSYAFMAGVAKDPATYIACNMGLEWHEGYVLQTDADWILDPRQPLLHRDVIDYNFTHDVLYKLEHP